MSIPRVAILAPKPLESMSKGEANRYLGKILIHGARFSRRFIYTVGSLFAQ
jgi:hypothetical protein